MTSVLAPVRFDAPLVNPSPGGLFSATQWTDVPDGEPVRWLAEGIDVVPWNFGGDESFGVWTAPWDASHSDLTEDDVKVGLRPERPDPFVAMTIWAADECDLILTGSPRDDVRVRAAQNLRLQEQVAVEVAFAERLLGDAGTPSSADDLVDALGILESAFATSSTLGLIHAAPRWLPRACQLNLVQRSGSVLKTPAGHTWVFGGGYVEGLGDTLVASSPTFGWRTEPVVRTAEKPEIRKFTAIAERSLLVAYEALVGAASIGTED